MAVFTNSAALTYSYAGGPTQQATSNTVSTTLTDPYSFTVTKTAVPATYRVGETVTYLVQVVNNGGEPLTTVTISDDLAQDQLTYVTGSARLQTGDTLTTLTPTGTTPLTFTLPAALPVGGSALLIYTARVDGTLATPLPDLTNTVTVNQANTTPRTASATITPDQYAELTIRKEADQTVVDPGDTLNYTLTITNTGTLPADEINITDTLPDTIATVNAVYLSINGGAETLTTDYTFDPETRLFTLPTTGTLTVPAAADGQPGTVTVRIESTVEARRPD